MSRVTLSMCLHVVYSSVCPIGCDISDMDLLFSFWCVLLLSMCLYAHGRIQQSLVLGWYGTTVFT